MSPSPTDPERWPELFYQTNIDRRTCKRVVPMQVLVIGMMRTGTKSMRTALKELGYNDVYHMDSCLENPPDSDMWQQAVDAKYFGKGKPFQREDWDQLLGHCEACCDCPTAVFMPELIAAYPDAKVIVSMRDPDAWYQSLLGSIKPLVTSPVVQSLSFADSFILGRWMPMAGALMNGVFDGKIFDDPEYTKSQYIALHEEVRQLVPKERLLEYRLGEGWGPMCDFLGKDVPKVPFPRINETGEFKIRVAIIKKQAFKRVAEKYLPYVGTAVAFGVAYTLLRA